MPHKRLLIHDVMTRINAELADPKIRRQMADVDAAEQVGNVLPEAAAEAFGRLRGEVQDALLAVLRRTSAEDRPVYLTWRHGVRQSIEISVPDQDDLPVDVVLSSRYDEDGGVLNTTP